MYFGPAQDDESGRRLSLVTNVGIDGKLGPAQHAAQ